MEFRGHDIMADAYVPFAGRVHVRDAVARHYADHGLPADGGASLDWFSVRLGPVSIKLPNPPARKRAVFFHDVNHVVTGYNTTFSQGEMAIAGFEVGAGCGRYWIAWYINLCMFALGLVFCPRDLVAAYARGRRSASIYKRPEDAAAIGAMTVDQVRALLQLDQPAPGATLADSCFFMAWSVAAAITLTIPVVLLIALVLQRA